VTLTNSVTSVSIDFYPCFPNFTLNVEWDSTKYMVCPESIQPINILKKVTDIEQWYLSPFQSTSL